MADSRYEPQQQLLAGRTFLFKHGNRGFYESCIYHIDICVLCAHQTTDKREFACVSVADAFGGLDIIASVVSVYNDTLYCCTRSEQRLLQQINKVETCCCCFDSGQ